MNRIKEKYDNLSEWLLTLDKDKLKFLMHQTDKDYKNPSNDFDRLKKIYNWVSYIYEVEPHLTKYVFGEEIATIDDIKNYMIEHMSSFEKRIEEAKVDWLSEFETLESLDSDDMDFEEAFDDDNHSCGYGGITEYKKVISFWKRLSEDSLYDIFYGDMDECDLDGHRNYWLSNSKVYPLFFSYLFYNNKFDGIETCDVYGTFEDAESLIPLDNCETLTMEEFDAVYEKFSNSKQKEREDRFNYMIDNIIKEFEDESFFVDRVELITLQKF